MIHYLFHSLGAPRTPDVLLIGAELSILFHSGLKVTPNAALNVSAPIDPYYWVLPSGAPIDRSKMMVVLNNLKGVYIKASYGVDKDGQARLGSFRHLNYLSRYNNSISNQKLRQSFSVDNLHLWLLVICVAISFF